ncbi:oligogalacturonate lyase family protein [Sphingomonas sp. CFBP 13720]|uniref:oligogalacturonate lyase family protein n=1 Tax=Sphingomonas sp. CFBP 13720 TaxID=2775302 RepID=UPI001780698A|nr:oligogalacturonate lyase family protein [Sphingomonas sp. CFBP 13720]MBD8676995.1 oligogalacturonate lyase [Sphingomonas sp. CFBP 13720]
MRFGTMVAAAAMLASSMAATAKPAAEWVDATTGHRVVRISRVADSASLYFHQNSYTPQGDRMVVSVPGGIATVDLTTWELKPLARGKGITLLFTGRRTRTAYYATQLRNDASGPSTIHAVDIDTGRTRKVADIPGGSIGSINADETLLLGQVALAPGGLRPDGTRQDARHTPGRVVGPGEADYRANRADGTPYSFAEAKERRLNERLEAGIPMEIFTIDLKTGERRVVTASTDWLNHIQFSPTDPQQIMYCHEGPWHKVDRIWTIRADGSGKRMVHTRTMNMEIAGHEFFSADGKTIWYDLQTPRGEVFWLAGYDLATGRRHQYKVDRNQWSVHYNQAPGGARFSGDGGDAEMVAHAPDGKYLYLFTPRAIPDVADIHAANADALIVPGTLDVEKLVDMRRHDYRLEPNMTFTPDGKWVVFRGNFEGATHIYAVEVAKAG